MNFSEGRQGGCGRTPSTPLNPPLLRWEGFAWNESVGISCVSSSRVAKVVFNTRPICTVAQECQRPENPQHNNLKLLCCENHNTADLFTAVLLVFRQHNKIKVLCCKHTHNTTEMDAIQRILLLFFWIFIVL